jgi:hypothetical protein
VAVEVAELALCTGTLVVESPEELLGAYLDPRNGYAWPGYDTLVTNGSVELVTGDLLAPALLEAYVDASRFRVLFDMLPLLSRVASLPPVALQEADDDDVASVAELFDVLDDPAYRRRGVRGTIVAKVLHRKRPDLVPIYDSRILAAYTAPGAIPAESGRTWVTFIDLLCRSMRADLQVEQARFAELEAFAASRGATLTRLRILDILVWMTISAWQ